ncbi:MAG TPA: J domain-containing protein [Rhizomicrobium sp.]|jgi:DnaJ-domain-containing protein 1
MKGNARGIATKSVGVEITLLDGSILFGRLTVPVQGRLSDVLNDGRDFVPIECADGSFLALAKKAIKQVSLPAAAAPVYRGDDPYRILGVGEDVSAADLRKAYHQLCATHHPDRIRGLGLGADYEQLATQTMARINSAYAQLVRRLAG